MEDQKGDEMREIRFRAWREKQEMEDDVFIEAHMDYDIHVIKSAETFFEEKDILRDSLISTFKLKLNEAIRAIPTLMQYTDNKDKNNKECWESDIIKDKYNIGVIHWGQDRWCWEHGADWGEIYWDDIEVIGNLHQNLELLNGKHS